MRVVSRGFLLVLVVASGLALGASTIGAVPSAVRVRPFAEVQQGDITFARDPADPTRGIFRVETSEPMICAIVWGETTAFGRFNNSRTMNGTGITDHEVVLPDVKADVTYSYVVQGTTADGTLYRSKVRTFELPAAAAITTPALVQGLRNVAPAATVTAVSSEYSAAFAGANAIDGDTGTEWATAGDGDDGSITIDLGAPTDIAAVEFVTRSMSDGTSITSRYTVAVDGGAPSRSFRAGTVARPRPVKLAVTGRVLQFDVARSTGGNVGAVEIRVYAAN